MYGSGTQGGHWKLHVLLLKLVLCVLNFEVQLYTLQHMLSCQRLTSNSQSYALSITLKL